MARSGHTIEKLLDLVAQDGAKGSGVQFLFGSAAPGGDTDEQDAAPIGSLYLRVNGASSAIYQKIASANAPAD
jgi:adenine/guanine phosphoribosyltransferase-like PRPP-binding protein